MSDTTETADSRVREESAAIKMICERVGLVVGGDNTSLAVDFAKIFLSKAPPEFLTGRSIERISAFSVWELPLPPVFEGRPSGCLSHES